MKQSKTITETRTFHICDYCGGTEGMAYSPPACSVCGKESCSSCLFKELHTVHVERPLYWAAQGIAPSCNWVRACKGCVSPLTERVALLNRLTAKATRYMRKYTDQYSKQVRFIDHQLQLLEKKRSNP